MYSSKFEFYLLVLFFLTVCVLVSFPSQLHAREQNHQLVIDVQSSRAQLFSDPLRLRIILRNTSDLDYAVHDAQLTFDKTGSEEFSLTSCGNAVTDFDLKQNQSAELCLTIGRFHGRLSTIFATAGTYEGEVIVPYSVELTEAASAVKSFSIGPLRAPVWVVLFGSIIGVIVSISFEYFYRRYRSMPQTISRWMLPVAILSVIMAVFLFRYSDPSASLPLKVQVNDLYGGIIIGFLFRPVIDWISQLILGDQI